MFRIEQLKAQRTASIETTKAGPPARTINQFFGVGPITDVTGDEVESRLMRFEFEHWLEQNYRKVDDKNQPIGAFTAAEIGRSMHRGYPADKILLDMMREIHRYFEQGLQQIVVLVRLVEAFAAEVLHGPQPV